MDQVELKGYRLFSNHGQRLDENDKRRMLTIATTILRKDVRCPSHGISPSDTRSNALKAELEKMPQVHLASLNSAKIVSWAQVKESGSLAK